MRHNQIKHDIENLLSEVTSQILRAGNRVLHEYPVESYLDEIKSYAGVYNYSHLSPRLMKLFQSICSAYDSGVLASFHKVALLSLMKESVKRLKSMCLPKNILCLCTDWFERILSDFSRQSEDFYDHTNDLFLKDLAVCGLRLIPVGGAWLTEVVGISRRFLLSGGVLQFMDASLFALFRSRGFKPFYQIHLDIRYLEGFSPQGRDQCYLGIADLLKLNSNVKGMCAVSWYYDLSLANISPHLLYLREGAEENGARFFRIGTTATDIKSATAKSATRRRLYHEGKYLPTSYLLIWPKREILLWADRRSDPQGRAPA